MKRVLFLLLVSFSCRTLIANDWPMFMGNVYFTGNNDEIVVTTNLLQWEYQAEDTIYNPIVSEGRVYFSDRKKKVYCLEQTTGRLLWELDLVALSKRMGRPTAVAGRIKYPVIKEAYLYLSDATALYCIDKVSGQVLWARAGLNDTSRINGLNDSIYADPLVADYRVIYGTRKYFMARNYTNGHVLWVNNGITSFGGFPSIYKGHIFTQSKDLTKGRFIIYCLDAANGKVVWSKDLPNTLKIFNPVIYKERIYIGSKQTLYCLDMRNGSRLWSQTYDELLTSGPGFTDRQILFTLGNHSLVVVDPENGMIEHRFETGEASSPKFATVRDQIYLAYIDKQDFDHATLKALSFDGGEKPVWQFSTRLPGGPSQLVADSGVVYMPAGNYLYAIGREGISIPRTTIKPIQIVKKTNIIDRDQIVKTKTNTIDLDRIDTGDSININNIYFELNKAYLKPESVRVLDEIIVQLKKYPRIHLDIRGHTDSSGDRDYNQTLSEKRAESVREYLIKGGISPHRLTSAGFGQDRSVASNDTEEGRALNRRTEFKVTRK